MDEYYADDEYEYEYYDDDDDYEDDDEEANVQLNTWPTVLKYILVSFAALFSLIAIGVLVLIVRDMVKNKQKSLPTRKPFAIEYKPDWFSGDKTYRLTKRNC